MSRTLFACPCPRPGRALLLAAVVAGALLTAGPAAAHHGKPHKPKNVRVVKTTTSTVVLAWKRTAPRFAMSKNARRQALTKRVRFTFTQLACGRKYTLGVRGVGKAGQRGPIVRRKAKTRPCQPGSPSPGPQSPATAPASTQVPQVSGTPVKGFVLKATSGSWTGSKPIAYSYVWQRCNGAGQSCVPVSGATTSSYPLGQADLGSRLRVQVTATNAKGSASAVSVVTAAITGPTGSASCSRADATGCALVAGSRITLLNERFSCRSSLAQIAAANPIGPGPGKLPLIVEVNFTTHVNLTPAVIEFREGCQGDGNDATIDLVLQVAGDGRTVGGEADAIKVRLTARDIQLTGYANCGPRGNGADGIPDTPDDSHQDGAQIQGGHKVEFIDFEWGDWETATATCQGAAGTFVPGSVNGNPVTSMACIRCKSVSCNHGMLVSTSDATLVVDSKWRTGNPADRSVPLVNGQIGLCRFSSPPCIVNEVTVGTYTILRNFCDRWPYEDELDE